VSGRRIAEVPAASADDIPAEDRRSVAMHGADSAGRTGDPVASELRAKMPDYLPRDLFGELVSVKPKKRGRPRHVPSSWSRALVTHMRIDGCAQPEIAKALGLTIPTLVMNYHTELKSTSQVWRRRDQADNRKN